MGRRDCLLRSSPSRKFLPIEIVPDRGTPAMSIGVLGPDQRQNGMSSSVTAAGSFIGSW
jgi:hypothetical protein